MAKNNDWLTIEHLVKLFEQSIDRDSIVEHNVEMPVLDSNTKRTRQCDIIIKTGKPPRQTFTLVEVQHRSKKVELTIFHGWLAKMKSIGAQHLICVSTKGFPESIKEEAKKLGGTVRLVWLKTEDVKNLPIKLFKFTMRYKNHIPEFVNEPQMIGLDHNKTLLKSLRVHVEAKDFTINNESHRISIIDMVRQYLIITGHEFTEEKRIGFPSVNDKLFVHVKNKKALVKIICTIKIRIETIESDSKVYNYEQVGDGTLVWMVHCECRVGNLIYTSSIPAIPNPDGSFTVYHMNMSIKPNIIS